MQSVMDKFKTPIKIGVMQMIAGEDIRQSEMVTIGPGESVFVLVSSAWNKYDRINGMKKEG